MICISIGEFGFSACKKALKKCESIKGRFAGKVVADLRLDLCGLDEDEMTLLFSNAKIPLGASLRRNGDTYLLDTAIEMGAKYIDMDIYASRNTIKKYISLAHFKGIKVILSLHDFSSTPNIDKLKKLYHLCAEYGADMFKVATSAYKLEDAERTMELYNLSQQEEFSNIPISAYTMGSKWSYTTIQSYMNNAPMIFCAYNEKNSATEEHCTLKQLEKLIDIPEIEGEIQVPSSRDMAQRAILSAALAKGESVFKNFAHCKDTDTTISFINELGANTTSENGILSIYSSDIINSTPTPKHSLFSISSSDTLLSELDSLSLFVGESRLLSRLSLPLVAQLKKKVIVTGDGALLDREMFGVQEALEQMNTSCILSEKMTLPAIINGPLTGGNITISGKRGSQFISGLLMALPLSSKDTKLTIEEPTSIRYLKLTVDVIRKFGIEIDYQHTDNTLVFDIKGKQSYKPTDIDLEGDWGAAAQFMVAAAIFGKVTLKGLNFKSKQGDKEILEILHQVGAKILYKDDKITIERSHLVPFVCDATNIPTLVSILIVLAAFCEGESRIEGIERLIIRSNNELNGLMTVFTKAGVDIKLEGTTLVIKGMSLARRVIEKRMLKGGTFSSYADHRIAMALKIATIATKDKVVIDDTSVIAKSYKNFESDYKSLLLNK